jgi:oligoendopeptidase F
MPLKTTVRLVGILGACAISMSFPASAAPSVRNRTDVPAEFKWDFSPIYPSWDAWESGMHDMDGKIDAFVARKGTLARGPASVLEAYQAFDDIGKLQYRLYRYTQLQRDIDTRDQAVAARFQRVVAIFARFRTATSWFTPELLTIPETTMTTWIAQTPGLAAYRFTILDLYRRQAHLLDEKGERLLSLGSRLNAAPGSIYTELSTSDIKFPTIRLADGTDVTLTPANYGALLETNRNQSDRAQAAAAHVGTYGATANTYAAIYNGLLQRDWYLAQARNFDSTLDAALDEHAIPRAVVETLVEATKAGTAPLHRYARLRQKVLRLPSYHLYDNQVSLFASDKAYPYLRARELAVESVAPLGEDYVAKYKRFVSGGRVDVYESPGKRSGAYNAGVYGVGPYLLMNYNDTLDSAFTLAHEAGHAMHTVLSYESQPFVTADYTIFVAEVASTTNERFLLDRLLQDTTDPKERFLLLQHAVDSIVGTFYTQVLFADFELRAHHLVEQGQPLTTEVLNKLYAGLLKEYWGDALTVDDFYKFTWARIPHLFNSPYYVYQYATCFASSARLFDAMTTGSPEARQAATARYLTLLRSGGGEHPMDLLKRAGVDLAQPSTIQAVVDQMDRLVTQMEVEVAKIR